MAPARTRAWAKPYQWKRALRLGAISVYIARLADLVFVKFVA